MEFLITQVQINLPKLIFCHMNKMCVHDNTAHGLGYGFQIGRIFEHFKVLVKKGQEQTNKDVLGEVDSGVFPTLSGGINAPMQRQRSSITAKNEEITALSESHTVEIDRLYNNYVLKHDHLV